MSIPNEQLQLIEQLLNLPGVRVLNAEIAEREMTIQIEATDDHALCHKCGQKATEFYCLSEALRLRHLPVFNRRVYLSYRPKRYRCLNCHDRPTTTRRDDWYDAKAGVTRAFAQFLLLEIVGATLSDVAFKHQVSYDLLRGLLHRHVGGEVDWGQFTELRVLGLDEISLLKGHRDFVTVISARDERAGPVVLAVLEGREKQTVIAFLQRIPEQLRATVKAVCTDLYDGFAGAVKEVLPQAKVVADRFHVAKLFRGATDALRKSEMGEIKQALKPEEYAAFKGVLWVWRRNQQDLTEEELEQLELLFECSPLLRRAHHLREKLSQIFETKQTKQAGEREIRAWIKEVKGSGLDCFDKFLATLETWMDEITNYFLSRLSSGWVEGLNNKIKVLKRRCYGIRNLPNLFRRIWLDLKGYQAFAH
jgi:transposase